MQMRDSKGREASPKSYMVAVILSAVFGILGIHHFYLGCWRHGIADLAMTIAGAAFFFSGDPTYMVLGILILGIDVIHTFVVTIMLLVGAYEDGDGRIVLYPGQKLM